jgi:non-heme chloroperoxidase
MCHWTSCLAKAVLIGAVPPLMVKAKDNPGGLPLEIFDQMRANVRLDRPALWLDPSMPFYGFNRTEAPVSEGVRQWFWEQGMMASCPPLSFASTRASKPTRLRT